MRRFILKLGVFCVTVCIGMLTVIIPAWYIGDIQPYSAIAKQQNMTDDIVIYNPSLTGSGQYKQAVITERQAEILLMGSSRILTFRDGFCRQNPSQFYNAGIRTMDMDFLPSYAEYFLSTHTPDVLLLAIDQPGFNADYRRFWLDMSLEKISFYDYESHLENMRFSIQQMLRRVITIDFSVFGQMFDRIEPVYGHGALGIDATMNGIGHRPDGSFQFGAIERDIDVNRMRRAFGTPQGVFLSGEEINSPAMENLAQILDLTHSQGVDVIVFFPPFSPETYENNIVSHPEDWQYLEDATVAIEAMVSGYGYTFYDFTNPESLNLTQSDMLDEWHLSERGSLILFQSLVLEQGELFVDCTTSDMISEQLQSTEHPWVIFEDFEQS